ncbi:High-affinity glucose transporter [Fusarium oxysporum f. sp. rapae]|uniref:High-affinity glucose transporter n=1 Tax=Fusarium oxysporum f. sp. rapae TaxID=485398 RepID=A0A8J5P5D0_FUSOX|nr:High-affinity glucose transporter [Fusarium oxysporum f. sp. rapae]
MAKIAEAKSTLNILIIVFVTLGSFSYGYSASIIASTLGQSHFISYFHLDPIHDSNANALLGATNGLFQTGGLFGALLIGHCADRFSRRAAIIIASSIICVGGALQAASQNITMFLVMRFFTGVGVGLIVGAVPLYQSEISPPHSRGLLVGLHGVLIGTGYSIAGWVGYACYPLNGNLQWRIPLALQTVTPALLCIGTLLLPESPRWLLQNDRPEEALAVLKRLHASAQDSEFQFARKEFNDMQQQIGIEKNAGRDSYLDLLTKRSMLKRVVVGFLTMFGAQCTGTLVINNYGTVLYSNVGYEGRIAIAFTAGWVTVSIAGNTITAIFVDKIGRVKFMIVGFAGIVCVLIGEIVCLALLEKRQSYGLSITAIAFLYGHIAFFSSCIDATTYIYASEIFPTHVRARGLSLSLCGLFLASLCFTQAATSALAAISWRYYIVFTVTSALMVFVLFFYFPETKGLSLEEVAKLFGDQVATDMAATDSGENIPEVKGNQAQEVVSEHCESV